ncbi:MAG TPA: hypothetical protein VH105_07665 [Burkholderiales bacterium]|nr:hypothetical protein [Burkholderiales bacterium]
MTGAFLQCRKFFAVLFCLWAAALMPQALAQGSSQRVPQFKVDPFWPKALPGNWILGQVAGIAVDKDDNVWLIHRPGTIVDDEKEGMKHPPAAKCCVVAPPVLKFDRTGNLLASWGGPPKNGESYDWPKSEHGIMVDSAGNVWLAGNDPTDHQILKFTGDGKFLQQIGHANSTGGSNSTTQLGRPAHMMLDEKAGELYVADGYLNHRVIVFDAKSGDYKRHWGAYGNKPSDEKQAPYSPTAASLPQFNNPVHCVRMSHDGLLYVCDRGNDRIQVFKPEGTFVKEFKVSPETLAGGSLWDLVLSEDKAQRYIYVADGSNAQIHVLLRDSGQEVGAFGRPGRMAGEFKWVHNMAIDSHGNLYTSEVGTGRRVQKFVKQK